MTRCEIPSNTYWCGREIPVFKETSIFAHLAACEGRPDREDTQFCFDLTEEELDYWLQEWRHVTR